jgi:hypothetical protein
MGPHLNPPLRGEENRVRGIPLSLPLSGGQFLFLPLLGGGWEGVSELYSKRHLLSPPLRGEEIRGTLEPSTFDHSFLFNIQFLTWSKT